MSSLLLNLYAGVTLIHRAGVLINIIQNIIYYILLIRLYV